MGQVARAVPQQGFLMVKIVIPPRGTPGAPPALTDKKPVILPPKRVNLVPKPRLTDALDASAFQKKVLPTKAVGIIPPREGLNAQANPTGITLDIDELLSRHPLPPLPMGGRFVLKDWQIEDISALVAWDRVALFLPVGAGKTVVASLIALAWGDQHRIVLVPPIIIKQWVEWINSIPGSGGAVAYTGSTRQTKEGKVSAKDVRKEIPLHTYSWWIMSFDIFKRDFVYLNQMAKGREVALLVDEAQNVKNTDTKLFKLAFSFSVGRKLCLMTGTELNSPADAFAYVRIKTPSVYRDHKQFENIHVAKKDFFGHVTEWRELDLMNTNLYMNSAHRTKEDVHAHLPKANYVPFRYDLAPAHMKLYEQLAVELLLKLEDGGKVDGTTTQALLMATQQIVINWSKFAGKDGLRPAAWDVIDTVLNMIDFDTPNNPNKFIFWTWFKETTRSTQEYLESLYPGRVAVAYSDSNAIKEVARFMTDPNCAFGVFQPRSAGAGLNPQYICYNSLFLETPSESILFRQSAGRIDREGQRFNANIWIAIARGTVQESLYENLLANDELVQRVKHNVHDLRRLILRK